MNLQLQQIQPSGKCKRYNEDKATLTTGHGSAQKARFESKILLYPLGSLVVPRGTRKERPVGLSLGLSLVLELLCHICPMTLVFGSTCNGLYEFLKAQQLEEESQEHKFPFFIDRGGNTSIQYYIQSQLKIKLL